MKLIMKGSNNFQHTEIFTALGIVIMCVCSQAFKLPIDLRRSIATSEHTKMQLENERKETLPEGMSMSFGTRKEFLFPEQTEDNEGVDYQVQLSFKNQEEHLGMQHTKDDNPDLNRFYKYSKKTEPSQGEAIVFPKDAENQNAQTIMETVEKAIADSLVGPRSDAKLLDNSDRSASFEELQKNDTINFMHSLETLAHMVRQLLFRVPAKDDPRYIVSSEPTMQTYDTSTELDVREQSLYAGPKIRSQSSNGDCPEGMKKTRNGSCQKPARRLIS